MKAKRFISLIFVAVLALSAGCSKDGGAEQSSSGAVEAVNAAVSDKGTDNGAADGAASNGGNAAEGADNAGVKVIYGEITEVIGNQVTVKEIEMPRAFNAGDMPEGFTPGEGRAPGEGFTPPEGFTPGEGFDPANLPDGAVTRGSGGGARANIVRNDDGTITIKNEDGTETTVNPADMQGGGFPGGGRGMQAQRQYTGEEYEIMIPTGIPVMTRAFENGAVTEKEIALDKLTGGDIITITYKADGKAIDSVYVQQASSGGGGGIFFNGGDGMMIPDGGQGLRIQGGMPEGGGEAFYYAMPAPGN